MVSLTTSSENRFVSMFQYCGGTLRKIWIGFFDSSLVLVVTIETIATRMMRIEIEYQK